MCDVLTNLTICSMCHFRLVSFHPYPQLAPLKYKRVNQDTLKTRKKCESLTREILHSGKTAIIDRCNFSHEQRKPWLDIAKEFHNNHVECIVFSYSVDTCIERCRVRKGHESIMESNADMVVRFIGRQWRPPVAIPAISDGTGGTSRKTVRCVGGEVFRRLEVVTSFDEAGDLVASYLNQR